MFKIKKGGDIMAKETSFMFVHSINSSLPDGKVITTTFALNVDDQKLYRWNWKTGSWKLEAKEEDND